MTDDDDEPASSEGERDARFAGLLRELARTPRYVPLVEGTLVGEYRVVRRLGRGSHGTVYEAVHTIIEKTAALKVLNPECSGDPLTAQRFVDEARAVNRIKHPNIVGIFGFGELGDGRKYCVMDLLEGRTLAAHLKVAQRFSAREAIHVLREIAQALDAAHAAGVIHRDLKPPNVFLSGADVESARVTLLDFGLARLTGDELRLRTGRGVVVGTPAYMAPEQCSGAALTPSTDIYALGNVAFELLTGRTPFVGSSSAMIAQHLSATPPAPSAVLAELPAACDVVFSRWLSKAPDLRPASASSAIRELAAALGV